MSSPKGVVADAAPPPRVDWTMPAPVLSLLPAAATAEVEWRAVVDDAKGAAASGRTKAALSKPPLPTRWLEVAA